ncbi:MAG: hypothetical protein IKD90_05035 [Clostridiales bacterium]|nr:hypothetical protein [Clostridiales bacterium]
MSIQSPFHEYAREVKVYSSFKSVSGSAAGTSSKKTTAKKTSASSAGKITKQLSNLAGQLFK